MIQVMSPTMFSSMSSSPQFDLAKISKLQTQVSSPTSMAINTSSGIMQLVTTYNKPANSTGTSTASGQPAFSKSIKGTTSVVASMLNSKSSSSTDLTNEYTEMLSNIKTEAVDDSYEGMDKIPAKQASKEAIGNLKTVLKSRTSSPEQKEIAWRQRVKQRLASIDQSKSKLQHPAINSPMPMQMLSTGIPGNLDYRLVPIGPPMALPSLQFAPVRLPGMSMQNILPASSKMGLVSTSGSKTPESAESKQTKVAGTSQVAADVSFKAVGGPLVVNASAVGTPMNGQLLTLPQAVVKKLTLNKALALKINNKQVVVPPSGFFQSSEGLKVFLPPDTFPSEGINVVAVSDAKKSTENSEVSKQKQQSNSNSTTESNELSVGKVVRDIKKSKHYSKCCLMQRLYCGFDVMEHIFKCLSVVDLLR